MAIRGEAAAALALHRFGFGPVRNLIRAVASDPRGALLADLESPRAGRVVATDLPSSGEAARAVFEFLAEQRAKQKIADRAKKVAALDNGIGDPEVNPFDCTKRPLSAVANQTDTKPPLLPVRLIQAEGKARFDAAIGAGVGFVERLVWFWSNHFCISADKIIAMAGPYEREAIRPHVLGRFVDLLAAVESHPAMLFYLDNVESMGPDSVAGVNRDKGLNENLAREILELHTLGVRSGYTQADVTAFASVLTGWTWIPPGEPAHGGEFIFNKRLHEPGDQIVLGKRYPDSGLEQGRAVLADLARHPSTARHVALKLARHFVADEPPPPLVAKLEKTFLDTGGDLKAVAGSLITAEESWAPQRTKLKPPAEWVAGILRLADTQGRMPIGRVMAAQAMLGEALWRPPAPNGYPDTEPGWLAGIPRRLDIANEFAGRLGAGLDAIELLDAGLGPLASADTRDAIKHAESRRQALTLLLMAPEFLRR
jgi:uncharacterized protein (DUF1800 family)